MKQIKIIIASAIIFMAYSCGTAGNESKKADSKAEQVKTEKPQAQEQPKEAQKVALTLSADGETMADIHFTPNNLTVPAGAEVTLTFTNNSKAKGMDHNFVLLSSDIAQEVATEGIKAGVAKDYIPDDNRIIAHTKLLTNGEQAVITFTAPAKGTYHFICTYPGHYPKMIGRFNVE